ncbi:membrane protein required for colicin V production [Candidatus Magnetomoraceae bacterium gMMP-15]
MNHLDIVIIVIVGFCLIRGLFRGLIKELASIIGVFAGFYIAYAYYEKLAILILDWDILNLDSTYINLLSFLLLFCAVLIVISILVVIIKYIFKISSMKWIDVTFGGAFGVLKAVLIISVLLIPLTTFLPEKSTLIKESVLAPQVTMVSEKVIKLVPQEFKHKYNKNMDKLKDAWNKKT